MIWKQARITCDTKDRVDAVKRAHDELVSFLTVGRVTLLREFKQQRGKIQDNEQPAQSYFEAFEESLHDGTIQATGTSRLNTDSADKASVHVVDAGQHRSSAYKV